MDKRGTEIENDFILKKGRILGEGKNGKVI